MQCKNCQKETNNPFYCSNKCFNAEKSRLAKKKHKCKLCQNCVSYRRKICDTCKEKRSPKTISDVICRGYPRCVVHNRVREEARKVVRDLGWKSCRSCGYSKHIEVCHIEPISSFSEDTLLSIVNHPDNLLPLCPNCHWEFDNDGLEVDGHKKDKSKRKNKGLSKHKCKTVDCNNMVVANGSLCKKCVGKSNLGKNQKIAWLELDELVRLVEETSFSEAGRRLGVSDNAIRKHIKNLTKHKTSGADGA